MIDKSDQALDR